MKVICDTNTSISGSLWRGNPNKVLKLAEAGKIELCGTFEILKIAKYKNIQIV